MPPSKQVIIDTLVLVFSKSRISQIVGTDALRSVLDVQYRDMIDGDVFHTQGVWDLLADQPGFDAEYAKPPLARFKQHEGLMGVLVQLPSSMSEMGSLEVSATAAHCPVSEDEVQKIITKHDPRLQAEKAARRAEAVDAAAAAAAKAEDVDTRNRLPLLIGALVVTLATFGFVGWKVYMSFSPKVEYASLGTDAFKGIPVGKAQRTGKHAVAHLSDDSWAAKKDKKALEAALRALEGGGIEVVIIKNKKGEVVASAQFYSTSKGRKVDIKFR